jgi:hypothetical protein
MRFTPTLLLLALLPVTAEAFAPVADYVRPGARVRITLQDRSRERVGGALMAQDADSLRVTPDAGGPALRVSLAAVKDYEVSRERHNNAGRGAGIGLLIGPSPASLGLTVGLRLRF